MGRPRVHDESTAALLLSTAEDIAARDGLAALSLRRLADAAGVSTRAVYSVFGSKDALVIALGCRGFDWLGENVASLPFTDDPVSDLVEAGAIAFRRLVVERPVLFHIGVQATWPDDICRPMSVAADAAWQHLLVRTERLAEMGLLGDRTPQRASIEFHAMCEGLAALEARGLLQKIIGDQDPATAWRDALRTVVTGFTVA